MADPLTIATIGGLALQGGSMAASAIGEGQSAAQAREDQQLSGAHARAQNQRLLSPTPFPAYEQQVQGYGGGGYQQYAPAQSMTPAQPQTQGRKAAQQAGMGDTQVSAQPVGQMVLLTPEMQAQMGMVQAMPTIQPYAAPQQNIFGIPWFTDTRNG